MALALAPLLRAPAPRRRCAALPRAPRASLATAAAPSASAASFLVEHTHVAGATLPYARYPLAPTDSSAPGSCIAWALVFDVCPPEARVSAAADALLRAYPLYAGRPTGEKYELEVDVETRGGVPLEHASWEGVSADELLARRLGFDAAPLAFTGAQAQLQAQLPFLCLPDSAAMDAGAAPLLRRARARLRLRFAFLHASALRERAKKERRMRALTRARARVRLTALLFFTLTLRLRCVCVRARSLRLTRLAGGGGVLAATFSHLLTDGQRCVALLRALAAAARGEALPEGLRHDRTALWPAQLETHPAIAQCVTNAPHLHILRLISVRIAHCADARARMFLCRCRLLEEERLSLLSQAASPAADDAASAPASSSLPPPAPPPARVTAPLSWSLLPLHLPASAVAAAAAALAPLTPGLRLSTHDVAAGLVWTLRCALTGHGLPGEPGAGRFIIALDLASNGLPQGVLPGAPLCPCVLKAHRGFCVCAEGVSARSVLRDGAARAQMIGRATARRR
jgi:hypothetical protein